MWGKENTKSIEIIKLAKCYWFKGSVSGVIG